VIGTSIGNPAAIIAGNAPKIESSRLTEFWSRVGTQSDPTTASFHRLSNLHPKLPTITRGLPAFFMPNPRAWLGTQAKLGSPVRVLHDRATASTLGELSTLDLLSEAHVRLSVGAVNARNGEDALLRSREAPVLPRSKCSLPARCHRRSGGVASTRSVLDGGSIRTRRSKRLLDDKPRKESVIFAVICESRTTGTRNACGK